MPKKYSKTVNIDSPYYSQFPWFRTIKDNGLSSEALKKMLETHDKFDKRLEKK